MNKKIASELAVGIVLILAIVIGVIFWMQDKSSNQPASHRQADASASRGGSSVINNQEAQRIAPVAKEKTQIKDEFADWQTYRNEKHGFEIRYPIDWRINISGREIYAEDYFLPPSHFECIGKKEKGELDEFAPCSSVLFGVVENSKKLSLEDYLKNELGWNYEGAYRDVEEININGVSAYKLVASSAYDGNESTQYWIPLKKGGFFEIGGSYVAKEEIAEVEKIVNSFKFAD